MSDFAFLESPLFDSIMERRCHREEVLRECFQHNMKNSFNSAETALAHLGDMVRAGLNVRREINEAREVLGTYLLMVDAYERTAKQRSE